MCLGWKRSDLELDHDEAGLGPVEEQQVDVEVVPIDLEVVLPADEGEAVAKLEQERLEPRDQGILQVSFIVGLGEVEEVQDVGVAGELLGELRCRRREARPGSWRVQRRLCGEAGS